MSRPVVFCSDFGLLDEFVGVCHGVIATIAPESHVIDLTHGIPPQNVVHGALTLARCVAYAPPDAVFLAVVDPGVGSDRRAVAVRTGTGAALVGPDNGLLSLAWDELGGAEAAVEITGVGVVLRPVSSTFHGRDVFAPAAAHLAAGASIESLGRAVEPGSLAALSLPGPAFGGGQIVATVTGVDRFGNVQLNVSQGDLRTAGLTGDVLVVEGRALPRVAAFAELPAETAGVLVDAQGFLAIVVNQGSAAAEFGAAEGTAVVLG